MQDRQLITMGTISYKVVENLGGGALHDSILLESEGAKFVMRSYKVTHATEIENHWKRYSAGTGASEFWGYLEFGTHDGRPSLLRRYVDAEPFDAFAKRFKFSPKRLESALNVGVKLCRGVESLHHSGRVHGALRSGNVFFDKDGSPIVTDPAFVDGASRPSDPREDVRALGLLLCRLYTGKPGLVINDYTLMVLAKAKVPRQLLRVLWQAIHEDAGAWCLRWPPTRSSPSTRQPQPTTVSVWPRTPRRSCSPGGAAARHPVIQTPHSLRCSSGWR